VHPNASTRQYSPEKNQTKNPLVSCYRGAETLGKSTISRVLWKLPFSQGDLEQWTEDETHGESATLMVVIK